MFGSMHSLVKLVISHNQHDPEEWLRALTSHDEQGHPVVNYPAPALRALWFFPPYPEARQSLNTMLEHRNATGHKLEELRVMCRKDVRIDQIRKAFIDWRKYKAKFEEFVNEATFDMVDEYPKMETPEACREFIDEKKCVV